MRTEVLFSAGEHRWLAIGRDPNKPDAIVDTNQYVITTQQGALLIDPGGIDIFPAMLSALTREVAISEISAIFASHQDPDICSSLSLWIDLCPNIKVYTPWLWTSFIAHFAFGNEINFTELPDESSTVFDRFQTVPAHYCHSSGNHGLYDPAAKILFSGDLGAALLPDQSGSLFVEDFDEHVKYMRPFHMRWMPSNRALRAWVRRVRQLSPEMICPQHGSIFRGDDVHRLLDWIERLDVEALDPMAG